MNLRHFSMAVLISAIPALSLASSDIKLDRGDFIAAERSQDGEVVLNVKLSKSGKAKLKKIKRAK